jgi:hypothetical protein
MSVQRMKGGDVNAMPSLLRKPCVLFDQVPIFTSLSREERMEIVGLHPLAVSRKAIWLYSAGDEGGPSLFPTLAGSSFSA